jgi:hypothetical protein
MKNFKKAIVGGVVLISIASKAYSMEQDSSENCEEQRNYAAYALSILSYPVSSVKNGLSYLRETSLAKNGFSFTSATFSKADQFSENIANYIRDNPVVNSFTLQVVCNFTGKSYMLVHRFFTFGAEYFKNLSNGGPVASVQFLEGSVMVAPIDLLAVILSEDRPIGKQSRRRVNCIGEALVEDVE